MILTISQHNGGYAARTKYNAAIADITVAFAVDFTTAGEKLTHKAAGDRYVAIPLDDSIPKALQILCNAIPFGTLCLNIAGNGIYTLAKHGWNQDKVNNHIFQILRAVNNTQQLDRVISGGQTGADIAGVAAAYALGVPAIDAILPKGFMQRMENGQDVYQSLEAIRKQITDGASKLR